MVFRKYKILVLAAWLLAELLCVNNRGFAGEPMRVWTAFRQEDGLAHNVVTAVVQTPDGAMWFATLGGVSRYDGHVWQKYGVEDGLPSNIILDLVAAPDGALWAALGHGFGGQRQQVLAYFSGRKWTGVGASLEFMGGRGVRQILGLDGGRACLVTTDGRLVRFDGKLPYVVHIDGRPLRGVQNLMADANGKVWVVYGGRGGNVLFGPGEGLGPGGLGGERGRRGRGSGRNIDGSGGRRGPGRFGELTHGVGLLDVDTGDWKTVAGPLLSLS